MRSRGRPCPVQWYSYSRTLPRSAATVSSVRYILLLSLVSFLAGRNGSMPHPSPFTALLSKPAQENTVAQRTCSLCAVAALV